MNAATVQNHREVLTPDALALLQAVADSGSFAAAARQLGLVPSAVTYRVRQIEDAWPNMLRIARLIPAVEYIQANRIRTLMMRAMADLMQTIDLYIAPALAGDNLLLTNLTGHPAIALPNGFSAAGTPTSITFNGRLYDETTLLAVAKLYQDATGFHLLHPPLDDKVTK